jgi:hypothetical protein
MARSKCQVSLAGGEPILPRHPPAKPCRRMFRYRRVVVQTPTMLPAACSAESAQSIHNIMTVMLWALMSGRAGAKATGWPDFRTRSELVFSYERTKQFPDNLSVF